MVLAGRPVTNAELARLMGVSPPEASKRITELRHLLEQGVLRKERVGREVRLSLPSYH
jgi:DNA-binding Lrp family transcriptional regulator